MGVLNTTPRTWVAAAVLTAAQLNAEIRDAFTAMQSAWTAYTPTTTGITLGNGTVTGSYNRVGKTIDFRCVFTFGSTSAVSGSPSFTLPVTALDTNWASADCTSFDTSATAWYPVVALPTTTGVVTIRTYPGTAGNNLVVQSSTVPFTWATGDIMSVTGRYQAA